MATSPTPSLDSLPGATSIGSYGEHNDYLSDSPLTLSGSSPPVSDSAICDDFSSSGATSSLESHHQTNSSASSSASSTSSSIGGGGSGSGGGPGGGIHTGTRCTGCKSKQSDAVAKCIDCVNYLCSNCVTAHQFMHCFDGHSVFRISAFDSTTTTPLTGNSLGDIQVNPITFLMQQQAQPQSQLSKLMMNGFDGQTRFSVKDEPSSLNKLPIGSILNGPPSSATEVVSTSTAMTTNNSTTKPSSHFCTRHKNELLKFFCRTCNVPACKDCMIVDHPTGLHECEHVQDATPKQIEGLLQIVAEVRSKAADMRQIIKNSEHNSARIQMQYHKAQNEITETYQFFRSILDERKQELFKELENFFNAKNMSHSVLLNKSQEHIEKVLQSCDFVERITKHAGLAETIMLRKVMENKLQSFMQYIQELQSTCELDFVSNYQAIQVGVRNTFGYIRSSSDIPTTKQPPIARPTNNVLTSANSSSTTGNNNSNGNNGTNMNPPLTIGSNLLGSNTCSSSILDRPFTVGTSATGNVIGQSSSFDSNIISKRFNSANSLGPFVSDVNLQMNPYEKWSNGGSDSTFNNLSDQYTLPIGTSTTAGVTNNINSTSGQADSMLDLTSKLLSTTIFPPKSQIKRQKMIYHCKFGEFGVMEGQFTEPSGVAVNAQNDIIVADTNNHRIQIFDKEGRFKFQFGECGKRDGQLLYPNRVAVVRNSGDIIVTERSPTHQIQIYNQYGQFVRKFGANILQHPRGVTVDNKGRIIVVECKVMRVIIFDQSGNVLQKFGCSKHLEFPNGVVVNDKQEIFISDNRAHCVKVFNYEGSYLRQIGGEGITNYPIGVGINAAGEILIADNHNNFNLTIFTQDGQLVSALESKVKHAQCFDVALMDDGSVVLASKDYRLYIYRYVQENESCSLEQFAVFFTNFVRSQTNKFLGTNATTSQNNQKSTKPSLIKNELTFPSLPSADHHVDEAKFTSFESTPKTSKSTSLVVCNSSIKSATNRSNDGLNRTAELTSTHRGQNVVKSLSFDGQLTSPNENHNVPAYSPFSKGHNNYKSTPKSSKMKHKSEKPRTPASFCLGDFINCSPVHRGKASKDPSPNYVKSPANLNISAGQSSTHQEPKKIVRRIVPTPVSPKTTSFTTPVFRSENKIFSVSKEEDLEVNNDLILKERECLKNEISIITKQLEQSSPMPTTNNALKTAMEEASPSKAQVKLDLSKVTQKSILDKIVDIQSTLIDLNLVANILSEFSFLLTLSTSKGKTNSPEPSAWPVADCEQYAIKDKKLSTVLRSLPNCVYFALRVLDKQKHMLALLDVTTLRVVLDNELLDVFCEGLKEFLEDIYNYKLQMEDKKSNKEACFPPTKSKDHFTNVFYSEDNDTRNNFPSENEFNAFRKQRDLFYSILQLWESGHLSPTFDFNRELGSKIRPMLAVEHPINMAHLSKLFISQLLISSRFSHELPPELDVDFLNIDKNKFAKLQQRLIAPSDFSINYQFPGNQVFFRDFIIAAKSVTFNEQLKLALVSELVDRNGSSYETISLTFTMDNENSFNEYVVRPETLETMRILSKFLGFVEAHPHSFDGDINSDIEAKQIELRNLTRPTFDVIEVLKKSIEDKKLLITIPWLVQYISMLDHITLRLNYYRDLINLLFEIYINLTIANGFHQYKMRPTNLFTLQCCLGWLFENINVFDDYYKYRQNRGFSSLNILKDSEIPENLEQSKKNNEKLSTNRNLFEAKTKNISGSIRTEILKGSFDPLLESILNTACPFLAELRMSVMRLRSLKSVSRSGRYRYITTKIFKEESPKKEYDSQTKLTEAFLHSQPLSVRRTVEFVTERTTSAVVKDFQMEVLLPAKKQAQKNIKLIKSTKLEHVKDEIVAQYANAHVEVQQQWNGYLHEKISTRVKMALDGLLPHEILPPVKSTCTRIIVERCKAKAENWKLLNLNNMEFYCKDARAEAQKHIEEMSSGKSFQSIVLEIKDLSKPIPSEVFKELQFLLYCTSQRPELVEKDSVSGFCRDLVECINAHNLPASVLMLALQMTIYMLQNLVLNCRNIFAQIPKENFVNIFTCDKVKDFITIDEESDQNRSKDDSKDSDDCKRKVHVFDSLITEIFIRGLGSNHECYECLSELLLLLINSKILRLNYLNDRFLTLFKVDLPKEVLLEISFVLDKIAKEVDKDVKDDEKSQLFVEMLADFVGSVEEF